MDYSNKLMRDAFIDVVYQRSLRDPDVYFISADFGAQALDAFRRDLPKQFIHAGISEQNMVDLGAGLALSGKKVFLYAMAPFITARCYEQTKATLASMRLPVTLVSVGVGLGYNHSALTHFVLEDIPCMRALNGIEVLSPSDSEGAAVIAHRSLDEPRFRYVRLERQVEKPLYHGRFAEVLDDGFSIVAPGADVCIVGSGHFTHRALAARAVLQERGVDVAVMDLFKIKPLDAGRLMETLGRFRAVVTVEEQILDGGFGSAVAEAMVDTDCYRPMKRVGVRDGFGVMNGSREQLHARYQIALPDIVAAVMSLSKA